MSLQVTHDSLSPALRAMAAKFADRKPILQAMGAALVSVTKRAFNDAQLRALVWPATKKSGGAPLKRSGALWQSIRIATLTDDRVEVGTDRPYAPYHQFGADPYTIRPKNKKALAWPGAAHPVGKVNHPGFPPRPFFPFDSSGAMTPAGLRAVESAARAKMRALAKASGATPS